MYEETDDPTQIIWEGDERYAIVAFLLMSIDGKMNGEDLKRFDAFMCISQMEAESKGEDWDDDKLLAQFRNTRDTVIREGTAFLDSLDRDESYCDYVLDEIDRIIEDTFVKRTSGMESFIIPDFSDTGKKQRGVLFSYARLTYSENGYSKNQKRLLKHLAQKWNIDKSSWAVLENAAKTLHEIDAKRSEIQNSDMPHREAVSILAKLEAKEKAVWEELGELRIPQEASLFDYDRSMYFMKKMRKEMSALTGIEVDTGDDEEESLVDKIGDCIVEGIYKFGDIICAPFEWMTDKIVEWT